jgi:gliding motility-associated-like protein
MSAEAPEIGIGTWFRVSGFGNIQEPGNPKSEATNLIPGNAVFEWQTSNGPCPVSKDQVTVQLFTPPGAPDAGVNFEVCGDSAFVSGNFPENGTSEWRLLSGGGVIDRPDLSQSSITGLQSGKNLILFSFVNGPCSVTDTLSIVSFVPPGKAFAGSDTSICSDRFIMLAQAPAAGSGKWSQISGTATFDSDTLASTAVSLPDTGQYKFIWTIQNGICIADTDTINIRRDTPSDSAILPDDFSVCADSVSVQAGSIFLSKGLWSVISGNGVFSKPDSAISDILNLNPGINIFRWEVVKGACRSSDTIEIASFVAPAKVNAGEDQFICGLNGTLAAENPDVGTGLWLFENGSSALSDPSDPSSPVEAYQEGAINYIWKISNGPCLAADTVKLSFYLQPSADAGADLTICAGDTAFLQANIPDAGQSKWSILSGDGLVLQPFFQNSQFIPNGEGNYYLRWTVVNALCRDSDLVVVSVRSPNDPFCNSKAVKLFVPEGFSPNDDGVFDRLVIQKPLGAQLKLSVFDRLGNLVYESNDYQNDWDGRATNGLVIYGEQLPESTYFYIVRLDNSDKEYKGYFTLWR